MLKKICGLFLGLVVLAGSACVTPTHASSASVVLSYIQTTGPSGAKEELVVIHNNSAVEVDISNWCLVNKANVAFACFVVQSSSEADSYYILPPYGSATVSSYEYSVAHGSVESDFSLVYAVSNQSSGSIVSSADTISLMNAEQELIDTKTWTSPVPTGKALLRVKLFSGPDIYAIGNDSADWAVTSATNAPMSALELRLVPRETDNEEGEPEGEDSGDETIVEEPSDEPSEPETETAQRPLLLTEIFPNAVGADAGKEFIEIYNTDTTQAYSLDGLKIRVGIEGAKWYPLPSDATILAGGYISFRDSDLGFTLVNTEGGIQLYDGDTMLGDLVEYTSPKDGVSWALIGGVWQYTNSPTPGSENILQMSEKTEDEAMGVTQKPCAANQFRNPETGRCKLLAATASSPTPCKVGQERNPETNRCRTIAAVTGPTPCKEGQERNPETNRCRTIVKMSSAEHGVKGVQTKASTQLGWYYWVAIIGIVGLIIAYAVWEWRHEIAAVWLKMRAPFAKR